MLCLLYHVRTKYQPCQKLKVLIVDPQYCLYFISDKQSPCVSLWIIIFQPKGEDVDISREKLSTALMMAFASMPFFEPFAIPLLLEKLDSSLPLAKVDSLKYLSCCATMYGPKLLGKHAEAIWASLKCAILYSAGQPVLPSTFDWTDSMSFQENEIMKEAFSLLQIVTSQPDYAFLDLIIQDAEIHNTVNQIVTSQTRHAWRFSD
ncbi:hypothetical protein Droror1_Dr00013490 [Drosera rotundifolia]